MSNAGSGKTTRSMVDAFAGFDHRLRISEGSFYATLNLTSDLYPVLTQRPLRGQLDVSFNANGGVFAGDRLCWINGTSFYYNGTLVSSSLSQSLSGVKRQFAQIGAYICFWPDKKYFNSSEIPLALKDMEASFATVSNITYKLCDIDGEAYNAPTTLPDSPENGDYWIDTGVTPHVLKQWSAALSTWVAVPTTYVTITSNGIGANFKVGDAVHITGAEIFPGATDVVIYKRTHDMILTTGFIDETTVQHEPVTISRTIPDMEYVTTLRNRIWGCSSTSHAVYACKLGDPTNWQCYEGLSSDSYAVTIGTPGVFTGAATLGNNVLFFKDDRLHKIYGTAPSNFQVTDVACRGIQGGSDRSAVVVNERLYYLSREGVCMYDGSLPVNVSEQFGEITLSEGAAGGLGDKYYLSAKTPSNRWHFFALDTSKGIWMLEDDLHATSCATMDGDLYVVDWLGRMWTVLGSNGTPEPATLQWVAETGNIGLSSEDHKYIQKVILRGEVTGSLAVAVSYDNGVFQTVENFTTASLRSFVVPLPARRCDHMRIRLSGEGQFKLYSISKVMTEGTELHGN